MHGRISVEKVLTNASRILQLRGNTGDLVSIAALEGLDLRGGFRQGDVVVLLLNEITKATIIAINEQYEDQDSPLGHIKSCILIYIDKCTPTATRAIQDTARSTVSGIVFEKFEASAVILLVDHFDIVGSHRLLDANERARVCKQYGETRLARIFTTDPVQRIFNAPIGSIYEIEERYGSLPPTTTYRIVCNPT